MSDVTMLAPPEAHLQRMRQLCASVCDGRKVMFDTLTDKSSRLGRLPLPAHAIRTSRSS
jgi:hypothetical protein